MITVRSHAKTCNQLTTTNRINIRVPQSSVLGPLSFIPFINDLPNINDQVCIIPYANGANIIITAENQGEISAIYESFCSSFVKRVNVNGLFFNIKKTNI